jgi:hypothetical protein
MCFPPSRSQPISRSTVSRPCTLPLNGFHFPFILSVDNIYDNCGIAATPKIARTTNLGFHHRRTRTSSFSLSFSFSRVKRGSIEAPCQRQTFARGHALQPRCTQHRRKQRLAITSSSSSPQKSPRIDLGSRRQNETHKGMLRDTRRG